MLREITDFLYNNNPLVGLFFIMFVFFVTARLFRMVDHFMYRETEHTDYLTRHRKSTAD